MTRITTLRGRLTALAVLAATIAIAVMVVAFNLVLDGTLRSDLDHRLQTKAAAAAATVFVRDGAVHVHESPFDDAIDQDVWVFSGTRPAVRAAGGPALQRAVTRASRGGAGFTDVPRLEVRLLVHPVAHQGRRVGSVVTAASRSAYDRTTDFALGASIALAVLSALAVLAGTWWTIGRALGPVRAMTRSAAQWTATDPDRRFGAAPRPGEIGELAATFDAMLDRVAASLRHEQRLSAELSHELRTPLARISAEIELLRRRSRTAGEQAEAFAVIDRSADQMRRILETLMAAARAEAQPQRGRAAVGEILEEVERTWGEPLLRRGIELRLPPVDGLTVGVDADVVERILAPVLDNAGRFARTVVAVDVTAADARVRLHVRDDGPGLDRAIASELFTPGVRGAGQDGHGGAGLGLALARRLARAAGGEITAAPPSGAGAGFVVVLPA